MNKLFIIAVLLLTLTACASEAKYITAAGLERANVLCENNGGIRILGAHWNIDRKSLYSVRCNNSAKFEYMIDERIIHDALAK